MMSEMAATMQGVELQRLEARVQKVAEACLAGQTIEDARVELKADWPTRFHKTARQIAAHANSSRGEPILWIIGLDERQRQVRSAVSVELANWWPRVCKYFDGVAPDMLNLVVPVSGGGHVTALEFDTSRAPYVVTTEDDGPVDREVPWRSANGTRTAYRHELMQALVEEIQTPELELVDGTLKVLEVKASRSSHSKSADPTFELHGLLTIFVSSLGEAMLPQHRQSWTVSGGTLETKQFVASIQPPYRLGRYTQAGQRAHESVGHIEVMESSSMYVHRSGAITVSLQASLSREEAQRTRFATHLTLTVRLPVDRTGKASLLTADFAHTVNSEEAWPEDDFPQDERQMVSFRPSTVRPD